LELTESFLEAYLITEPVTAYCVSMSLMNYSNVIPVFISLEYVVYVAQ